MTSVAEPATGERALPHDLFAERSVLGAMLQDPRAVDAVAEALKGSDFYQPRHTAIFEAVLALAAAGQERPDSATVAAYLEERGQLARVGGRIYLFELLQGVPVAENAGYYAKIVKDRARLRQLIAVGAQISQLGYGTSPDALEAVDRIDAAQQLVYDLSDTSGRSEGPSSLAAELQPALDLVEAAMHGGGPAGIPTGFADLTRLLNGGTKPGQLIVIGGRPGMGKSTLGVDLARAAAIKHNVGVAIFSLEMSKAELVLRILAAESRVEHNRLETGNLSDDDWTKLARRMGEIAEVPLFVDDEVSNLMQIWAKARQLKREHNIKMIVVDYLQLVPPVTKLHSREQEVAELSRGLKLMAKALQCVVIAIAQLNRGPEQRADKIPGLSDLRESGSVEQDADIVMLLHRPDYYDKESPRAGEMDIIVAKHRNGSTDTIPVAAQLNLARFADLAIV